jgi:hypothetical protein
MLQSSVDFLCLGAGLNIFNNCRIGLAFGFAFQDIAQIFIRYYPGLPKEGT